MNIVSQKRPTLSFAVTFVSIYAGITVVKN